MQKCTKCGAILVFDEQLGRFVCPMGCDLFVEDEDTSVFGDEDIDLDLLL